jgi:hypothetical protein
MTTPTGRKAIHLRSAVFYAGFLLLAASGIVYGNSLQGRWPGLRLWDWSAWAWLLAGIPFLFLQAKAGLPEVWDERQRLRDRLYFPLAYGILFGLADLIIIEHLLPHPPHTTLPPYTQPFPYSVFLYGAGGFEVEVFYRLIPITLGMLVLQRWRGGRYGEAGFVTLAILTALREPLEQWPSGPAWFVGYALASSFAMNMLQALLLRRNGFAAPVAVRMGHYLVWHILNGILIQQSLY